MALSQPLASKTLKKLLRKLKRVRSSILILVLGLCLIAFGGFNYYRVRILSFDSVPEAVQKDSEGLNLPVEIIIPSINIDLNVDPGGVKNGVWQISSSKATFLDTSAIPGTGGNTVIYGHNKKVIFGNLPYLSIGQEITIKTQDGKLHNYKAENKYFVGPDRVDLVSPSSQEELTIYTCWGVFDQARVVIKARPI